MKNYRYDYLYYDKHNDDNLNDNSLIVHIYLEDFINMYYNVSRKDFLSLSLRLLSIRNKEEIFEVLNDIKTSNESKEKMNNGYFLEFWFKLDKVQILQHCDTTASEEYIFYSCCSSNIPDVSQMPF